MQWRGHEIRTVNERERPRVVITIRALHAHTCIYAPMCSLLLLLLFRPFCGVAWIVVWLELYDCGKVCNDGDGGEDLNNLSRDSVYVFGTNVAYLRPI